MIKQILNRLPRRNSYDGNESGGRPSASPTESNNDSITNSAPSRETLVTTYKLSGPVSRSPADAPTLNGTISTSPAPKTEVASYNTTNESLPLFRDVPLAERPTLFLAKLKLCSNIFDFRDPTKNLKEKDIKKQTLLELVDFISAGNMDITEQAIEAVTKMVTANLFRSLPPSIYESANLESFDFDDEEPSMEPAWPHLQVVYEFFLRFVTCADTDPKIARTYVNQVFVLKLVELFDSEDSREREYLKTVLHRIYGKFMVHRAFIRKAINNVFYRFVFETERHNGIAELLEILGSIINGFAYPLKEEHKIFLRRALIPLHKAKCVAMYHRQLCYCMIQFIDKDFKLADTIIKGILKYWPLTNSHKEVLFLGELEDILEVTQPEEFQRCIVPLFKQLGCCLNSPHFQVAERAFFFWNNDHFISLVIPNRAVILPLIFPALEDNTNGHWNQAIHGMTMNARKLFLETDQELFQECKRKFQEQETNADVLREKQNLMWQRLEAAALSRGGVK